MPPVLVFDVGCGGCCYVVDRLLDTARLAHVAPVALQSERGQRLLSQLDARDREASWHFVAGDGTITSGADVAVSLAAFGGRSRMVIWPLRRSMPIARPLYRLMASRRTSWSRLVPRARRDAARARLVARLDEQGDEVGPVARSCSVPAASGDAAALTQR
jgi:predicted DCC family thiol-disulfide oxidoreductase YuxK